MGLGEVGREVSGNTLLTDGLLTCIAVIIRNTVPGDAGSYDKVLAHVTSHVSCGEGDDEPSYDQQLANIWALYDQNPFPSPEALVIYPPPTMAAQGPFNEYIYNQVNQEAANRGFGTAASIERDQTNVMEPGGSRLWIDQSQTIYWSTFDEPIA